MEILSFEETKNLFIKYNIPCCQTEIFNVKEKALAYAKKVGFPVVLKIHSKTIFHKSEIGGVKVGIKNEEEFIKAWDEISRNIEGRNIEGLLVQEMVGGREVAMGMKRDNQFGPVLMFGLGGIFIEVLNDVSFRIAPITKAEALVMIKEIKGYKILKGYREGKVVDIQKIADILVSLSKMSLKEEYIKGIDLNPVVVTDTYAKLIDFRVII
ncbi:MAG: acetate--CoA ligase family protein [Candidatus Pacebacteria bacterium]|nr:acetate--CoA ligase family protein [Candidatus Paceibacterota bacterium]